MVAFLPQLVRLLAEAFQLVPLKRLLLFEEALGGFALFPPLVPLLAPTSPLGRIGLRAPFDKSNIRPPWPDDRAGP